MNSRFVTSSLLCGRDFDAPVLWEGGLAKSWGLGSDFFFLDEL
jgi:hypothetical protein